MGGGSAANQSWRKEGAEAKKGSSRRTGWGLGWGGNLATTPTRRGQQRIFPVRNSDLNSARDFFTRRNCWRRPERREPEEEREAEPEAEPGGRHKGGGLAAAAAPPGARPRGPARPKSRTRS